MYIQFQLSSFVGRSIIVLTVANRQVNSVANMWTFPFL